MAVDAPPHVQPSGVLVVMYHYVRDPRRTPFPALKTLHPDDFAAQLDWLAATRRPTTCDAFEAAAPGEAAGAFILTFDDGFIDHYETVFPALRDRGWPGVFFVAGAALEDPPRLLNVHRTQFLLAHLGAARFAEAVEREAARLEGDRPLAHRREVYRYDDSPDLAAKHRLNYEMPMQEATRLLSDLFGRHIGDEAAFARGLYLSRQMIREMSAGGMTFGFHTEDHPVLSRLDGAVQRQQVARGVSLVRSLTGQTRVPFCYPYGHVHTYNRETHAALAEAGYGLAFNTERRLARPGIDPRFEIPRFDTRDLPPFADRPRG